MIHAKTLPHRGSSMRSSSFIVGRSRDGSWTVREIGGFVAATFPNRSEAIRFARSESGERQGAVVLAPFTGVHAAALEALLQSSGLRNQSQSH